MNPTQFHLYNFYQDVMRGQFEVKHSKLFTQRNVGRVPNIIREAEKNGIFFSGFANKALLPSSLVATKCFPEFILELQTRYSFFSGTGLTPPPPPS